MTPDPPAADHHAAFLRLLPGVLRVARTHARRVACPGRRDDLVAEAVALCWVWYARLTLRGRHPDRFAPALARFAAAAAASGRRACGQERVKDVLSATCRRRRRVHLSALPPDGDPGADGYAAALRGNARTPVPDQVQFRVDFPAWAGTLPPARRRLLGRMADGHRTADLAREFGLTPGRVSQLRGEFRAGYAAYCEAGPPGSTDRPVTRRAP